MRSTVDGTTIIAGIPNASCCTSCGRHFPPPRITKVRPASSPLATNTDVQYRWLMINGREVDALKTLARLHPQGNLDDPFVRGKFPEMKIKVAEEAANSC